MEDRLALKSFKGVLWNTFGSIITQGISFALGIVLARMIHPESYGLIAMAMIFISMTGIFINGGFGAALIRKKEPTQKDYNTVFWFNIGMALIIYVVLFFLAPEIGFFFKQNELKTLIQLLSISFLLDAVGNVPLIQLYKKLEFKKLNIVTSIAVFLSGLCGIILALNGFGITALVVQTIATSFFRLIGILFINRWIPRFSFCRSSFFSLFEFGGKLFASGILDGLFQNLYPLIIGRYFAPAMLAYYNRADSYQRLFSKTLTGVVQKVSFPSLAPLQDDDNRLKKAYRQMIRMVMLVNAPLMLGLIIIAEPLIFLLITEAWLPAVPYLQWLCLAGLIYPLHAINLNMLNVKGRSDIFLKLEIIKKVMIIVSIFAGLPWGVKGLVIAQVIFNFLAYFLNSFYSLRIVNYSIKEQIKDIAPYISLAILASIAGWLAGWLFWSFDPVDYGISFGMLSMSTIVLLQIASASLVYCAGCVILKPDAWKQITTLLKEVFLKKEHPGLLDL